MFAQWETSLNLNFYLTASEIARADANKGGDSSVETSWRCCVVVTVIDVSYHRQVSVVRLLQWLVPCFHCGVINGGAQYGDVPMPMVVSNQQPPIFMKLFSIRLDMFVAPLADVMSAAECNFFSES